MSVRGDHPSNDYTTAIVNNISDEENEYGAV